MLTLSNFCPSPNQYLSESRLVGGSYRVPLCINGNITGVICMLAVLYHLINNDLKVNLK